MLGVTGSVATIKIYELIQRLLPLGQVKVVTTQSAKHFFDASGITVPLYTDKDEYDMWKGRGDPVLHIELREWADILIIAPLSANTLAKLANGLCDNLLTCVVRAWDKSKPVFVAPAMNTAMWEHPFTALHLETLTKVLHYHMIPPREALLMCKTTGMGAMATIDTIEEHIKPFCKL
uniref:Flavoprotein domain-containing protein n=1 Tax=Arcella intermedia TaxID=1963864 RepID=A0A6B2LLL1_9EUKA